MKENCESAEAESNEDDRVVNVEKEMAGLIDIFNEQKKRQETKNVLAAENAETATEKKGSRKYQEKLQALQKYIPALQRVMDNMDPSSDDGTQKMCRKRLEIVYSMIEHPKKDKPLKYEVLEKLERILHTIATLVKGKKSSRAGSPSLKSLFPDDKEEIKSLAKKDQPSSSALKKPFSCKTGDKLLAKSIRKTSVKNVGKAKYNLNNDKVPNDYNPFLPSKSFPNKKNTGKNVEHVDSLFTPDPIVSRIRHESFPKSITESGTPRGRFPYSVERQKAPFPQSNRYRAPYPDKGERCRVPYPENERLRAPNPSNIERHRAPFAESQRHRAPYLDSGERYKASYPDSVERYRAPYTHSGDRCKAPYSDSVERYRAPYPDSVERCRAPYTHSGDRCKAPYSDSVERYRAPYPDGGERYRAPCPDDGERYRAPYPDRGERYRAPYSDDGERYRAPYPDSGKRYSAPYPDDGERYRAPYPDSGKRYSAPYPDSSEKFRARYHDIRIRHTLSYEELMEKYRPKFTDEEERYYEKPKSSTKTQKVETYAESSILRLQEKIATNSSSTTKSMNEEFIEVRLDSNTKTFRVKSDGDSSNPPSEQVEETDLNCSRGFSSDGNIQDNSRKCRIKSGEGSNEPLSGKKENNLNHISTSVTALSSDINIQSSLSSSSFLDNMEELMQQKDLEKLTQSTQQLKSLFNNRLKNMQVQRLLMANTNKDLTTTFRDTAASNKIESSGDNREIKNVAQEKYVKEGEELEVKPTNEGNTFIDNIMSNLTTKFGAKRVPILANEQKEKHTNKPVTIVGCGSNNSEKLELKMPENTTKTHETNLNLMRRPLWSAEDSAEVISTVKQIPLEKQKSQNSELIMNSKLDNQTSFTAISKTDTLENHDEEPILIEHEKASSQTTLYVPKSDDMSNIDIPGLDGIIPPALEKSYDSFHGIKANQTKDHFIVTKGSKSITSHPSQENYVKPIANESNIFQKGSTNLKLKSSSNENLGEMKQNQHSSSTLNEDSKKIVPNQSLRSKLSGEISMLHKVGTPCGGALRGLVKRDKMMPSGQIASLKPGALYDLISEDKPSRSASKAKNRQLQLASSTDSHSSVSLSSESIKPPVCPSDVENYCISGKSKNPDDILSKLSENDLKKIISDNIGTLPTPPSLPFLNNAVSPRVGSSDMGMIANSQGSGISWNNQGTSVQQINVQTLNVIINNTNVQPSDNNITKNPISHSPILQSASTWGSDVSIDLWKNKNHSKDPRRESQLASNITAPHSNLDSGQHLFNPIPDVAVSSFEKPSYSSSYSGNKETFIGSERENSRDSIYFNSYSTPVVLQTDPNTSPCYDGSATPDPYRPDPYTLSLKGSFEKSSQICNDATEQLNILSRPHLIGEQTTFESHGNLGREITPRPPLLRTPPLPVPRPALLPTPSLLQERELYSNYSDNQHLRFNNPRNIRRAATTYAEWKAEKNMAENMNLNFQDGPKYGNNKTIDEYRNHNRFRWTRDSGTSSYDHRSSHYSEVSCRNLQRESEAVKKLSARDPRRKSIEDKSERKDNVLIPTQTSTASTEKTWERQSQRDPRTRRRTPPRGRSISRDRTRHYDSRDRSLSKGRHQERSPSRHSDHRHNKSKDTYSSPLDQLYTNTSVPKTGLGYGLQNFRIPKFKKAPVEQSSKHTMKTLNNQEITNLDDDSSDNNKIYTEDQKATSESVDEVTSASEKDRSDQKKDINMEASASVCDDENIQIDCISDEKHSPEDKKKTEKAKLTSVSKYGETDIRGKVSSTEEELDDSLCRRSKRLLKKKRSRPARAKSVKKQIKIDEKKTSSDTKHQQTSNIENDETEKNEVLSTNHFSELKSSFNSNEKHKLDMNVLEDKQAMPEGEQRSIYDKEKSDDEENLSKLPRISQTNPELHSFELKIKETESGHCMTTNDSESVAEFELSGSMSIQLEEVTSSCAKETVHNHCDTVPGIKIIKQVELLEDVIGIKLTPDKIRKMAEILYIPESKESKTEEQPQEVTIDATKPVQAVALDLRSLDQNTSTKPKRKYKNELDRLQDDISKYHDSEAIAAASGPRQCRLQKERDQSTGKYSRAKPSENMKKKIKKCKEDELYDSEEVSVKDGASKCDLDRVEENSIREDTDEEVKEDEASMDERNENQNLQSDSSSDEDPIHLYSEKMRSKYGFILEKETKGEQGSNEITTKKSKFNIEAEVITSSVNTKSSEQQKTETMVNQGLSERNTSGKDILSVRPHSGNNAERNELRSSDECSNCVNEKIAHKCLDKESNFVKDDKRNKVLANNILHKYGLKKQRKKSFWSAGIIRRKNKLKKSDGSVSAIEDNIDKLGLDIEEDEDVAGSEAPDLNYYQDGESKATKCKLCSFNGKSIVTHYAITHPKDEVLISRMSPKAAEIAVKESDLFFSLSDEKKKECSSLFECRVCFMKFYKFSSFFEHIALHTGEFRHECCKCGYRTSTRSGILKHYQSHNVKNTKHRSCRVLYKEPQEKTFFCGYLCSLCNYFQISQNNVKRHVENVHDVQDFNKVVKINFSKVSFDESDLLEINNKNTVITTPPGTSEIKEVRESTKKQQDIGTDLSETSENQSVIETCNGLRLNELSEVEVPDTTSKLNKSSSEECLDDSSENNRNESVDRGVGELIITNSLDRHSNNIMDTMKTSVSQDIVFTSQNAKDVIIKNEKKSMENCNSSVDAVDTKTNGQASNVEGTSDINTVHNCNSLNTIDPVQGINSLDTSRDNVNTCCTTLDKSLSKDIFLSTSNQEATNIDSNKNANNSAESLPNEGKDQRAPMLIQNDWFLSLCKNIAEINHQYLTVNANASVSSRVESLKLKADSANIADEVNQRCISGIDEEAAHLNDFLEIPVSFKVERKKNLITHNSNESLSQENLPGNEAEETVPARRHLPERTCKGGFTKQATQDLSSDEDDEVDIYKMIKDTGQNENDWNDDIIVKEEVISDSSNDELKSLTSTPENISHSLPCLSTSVDSYMIKNASRKPLSIQDKLYTSSLPTNTNFSEFTHVMKQISQVSLKVSEIKDVKVGGLKVLPSNCGVIFSCSVKIFNKECGFHISDLETFGQHVNMLHHTSYWNGVCCSCQVHFVQDPNSHDKVSINTQSKAFCHLVREHLTFTKKPPKSATRGSSTPNEVSEEIPAPRLRVRRFSGDKLSGTDAANTLPQPNREVTGSGGAENELPVLAPCLQGNTDDTELSQQSNMETEHPPSPTEEEISRGIKIFKPFNSTKGAKFTFKVERIFQLMCTHPKLRHLYKCMGAQCSFTTTSQKEFARHFDDHREIHVVNPDDDPHRGFWNLCAYCLTPHPTSKELYIHIRKEHAICTMQCSKCFYRAKSIANVYFHHTFEHPNQSFLVLHCDQLETNLPPYIEKPFTEFVSAFRCSLKESCALFTYMLHTFCTHLSVAHPDDLRCHLCMEAYPTIKTLLRHYRERHGIGLFQCLFCTFGASSEHEIRLHLCYEHPSTDPKALQRTDNTAKLPNAGLTNRESIKRLMFYKDQDKLMKFVDFPPSEPESQSNSAMLANNELNWLHQEVKSPTRKVEPAKQENNRSMLLQTASALSALQTPKFNRPAILRRSLPAETSNPLKMLRLSPQQLSHEGPTKSVPIQVTQPFPSLGIISPSPLAKPNDAISNLSADPLQQPVVSSTVELGENTSASPTSSNSDQPTLKEINIPSKTISNNDTESNSNANYFKCGNKGCFFETSTSTPLRNHLVICDQARQSQKLSCAFCNRVFKQVVSFVEHQRTHGPERYSCSMCSFKASLVSRVNSHMKACHHVFTTIVIPVDPTKEDSEKDYFIVNSKEKRRGGEKPGPKGKAKVETKTKFSPEELDEVPKAAIFHNPLGCRLCSYETKVRSNLIRHIQQHTLGDSVSHEEVVNPVPEKTEKMFDKMMNLAGSSHKKKSGPENAKDELAVECIYKYVPDQDRYKCHVKECGYRTLSETMLRDHISVIHKDETYYVCPHCINEVDIVPIPIDQLSMHLKLHDSPVFKCAYCHFCSHIRRSIERHTEILHPGDPVDVQAVRLTKPDQNLEKPAPKFYPTDKIDEQGEEWYCCSLCVFKTKKKKIMLQHGIMEHKMTKPFKCSSCEYKCTYEQTFRDHISSHHPDQDCQMIALYKKVTEVKKPPLPPIPPLWKRDAKRLKLIRGIKLDEKGDAPPPVATATTGGIDRLDLLELKFGHFGKPVGTNYTCPRCSTSFMCKNRQEMKEHLYKDLEYNPILCKICKIGSTQRTKVMKHLNKVHNIEWDRISECLDINVNDELERWVEKVLNRQQSMMIETSPTPAVEGGEPPRKRRRSSVESTVVSLPTGDPTLPSVSPTPPSVESPDSESLLLSQESISSGGSDKEDHRGREKRKRDKCPSRHRFKCEYCDVTTKYKHSIILHCRKVHQNLPPRVNTLEKTMEETVDAYNCMYCNCTALNLNNLKHHWTHTHKNSGLNFLFRNTVFNTDLEYECYWCKKQSDLESLEEHCRDSHSADQRFLVVSVSVPKYKCAQCTLLFKSIDMLKRHFVMAHPTKEFCYIVVNDQRPVSSSDQNSLPSSSLPETSSKPSVVYKCFNCPFVHAQFRLVVKHMQQHFVTFVCTECASWFPSESGLRSHMSSKHPSSNAKPHILKGSEMDIENAKKDIIVIESGIERKITEEELAEGEKENRPEEPDIDFLHEDPLQVHMSPPAIKCTARKSTGSHRYSTTPPKLQSPPFLQGIEKSPSGPSKTLFKPIRKRLNLQNTFVTVKSNDKVVKLPAETLRKLINLDAEPVLTINAI